MPEEPKSTTELYRELRNLAGLSVIVYLGTAGYFVWSSTQEDLAKFGLYLIVLGVLFALLGLKTLQIRGWVS